MNTGEVTLLHSIPKTSYLVSTINGKQQTANFQIKDASLDFSNVYENFEGPDRNNILVLFIDVLYYTEILDITSAPKRGFLALLPSEPATDYHIFNYQELKFVKKAKSSKISKYGE